MPKETYRLHLIGDPDKLAEAVLEEALKRIKLKVEEAYTASRSILDDTYKSVIGELEKGIEEEAKAIRDDLLAYEASRTVELRKEITKLKLEYVERALSEALRRMREVVSPEKYKEFIKGYYISALESMKKYSSAAIVVPCKGDEKSIQEIMSEVNVKDISLSLASEPAECHGGFFLQSSDGRVRLDYRIETVLGRVIDELRTIALKQLFPS